MNAVLRMNTEGSLIQIFNIILGRGGPGSDEERGGDCIFVQ